MFTDRLVSWWDVAMLLVSFALWSLSLKPQPPPPVESPPEGLYCCAEAWCVTGAWRCPYDLDAEVWVFPDGRAWRGPFTIEEARQLGWGR